MKSELFFTRLSELRESYAKLDGIDPMQPTYKLICIQLDNLSTDKLQIIADAKIKFLSSLANNRIIRRTMQ